MRKNDKLKNIQEANKKLLGESMGDSENVNNQMDRLDDIRKQTGIGEPRNQCRENARRVFFDFNIDTPYSGDFDSFYEEYFDY